MGSFGSPLGPGLDERVGLPALEDGVQDFGWGDAPGWGGLELEDFGNEAGGVDEGAFRLIGVGPVRFGGEGNGVDGDSGGAAVDEFRVEVEVAGQDKGLGGVGVRTVLQAV